MTKDILISKRKLLSPYASNLFIVVSPHLLSYIGMCRILNEERRVYLSSSYSLRKYHLVFRDDIMVAEARDHGKPHPGQLAGDGPHGVQGLLPREHFLGGVGEIVSVMRNPG